MVTIFCVPASVIDLRERGFIHVEKLTGDSESSRSARTALQIVSVSIFPLGR
jgi:hypothetical protein